LLPKAIACFLVDLSKGNALARGNGRVQGDGTAAFVEMTDWLFLASDASCAG